MLSVEDVRKEFAGRDFPLSPFKRRDRAVRALQGVTFQAFAGQVVGLLGPNGAGKTTLMKIICDLLRADSGRVSVAGFPVPAKARMAQQQLGLVTSNERSFFWRLTVLQNLEFFAALKNVPRGEARCRARSLLRKVGMERHEDRLFRTLSSGMKQKVSIARALLADPTVLLLDEPTTSLDPPAAEEFMNLVRGELASAGKCILWATHRLEEVKILCDRVLVLAEGQLTFDDSVEKFMRFCDERAGVVIEVELPPAKLDMLAELVRSYEGRVEAGETRTRVLLPSFRDPRLLTEVLRALIDREIHVMRIETDVVSSVRVFSDLIQKTPHGIEGPSRPGSRHA